MTPRALVQNAADPKQVKNAKRTEKQRREQELNDLREVMATPTGRRFVWRLLGHTQTFGTVMARGVEQVLYVAGKQDVGHFLLAEVLAANQELYLLMQQEAYAADRRDADTNDAAHTESAITQDSVEEQQDHDA